jgi:hypothetical protein
MFEDLFAKKSEMCCKLFVETKELQHQIEVGDQLLAAQRERLIRLTTIKNVAQELANRMRALRNENTPTFELHGLAWLKIVDVKQAATAIEQLENCIASLEVDTALSRKV